MASLHCVCKTECVGRNVWDQNEITMIDIPSTQSFHTSHNLHYSRMLLMMCPVCRSLLVFSTRLRLMSWRRRGGNTRVLWHLWMAQNQCIASSKFICFTIHDYDHHWGQIFNLKVWSLLTLCVSTNPRDIDLFLGLMVVARSVHESEAVFVTHVNMEKGPAPMNLILAANGHNMTLSTWTQKMHAKGWNKIMGWRFVGNLNFAPIPMSSLLWG